MKILLTVVVAFIADIDIGVEYPYIALSPESRGHIGGLVCHVAHVLSILEVLVEDDFVTKIHKL